MGTSDMTALQAQTTPARRSLDRDGVDYTSRRARQPDAVSDQEVETFIQAFAQSGFYHDELGQLHIAVPLFQAVAIQWVSDKSAVGEFIRESFWHWCELMALFEKRCH